MPRGAYARVDDHINMKSTIVSILALAGLGGLTFAAVDQHATQIQHDLRNAINQVLQKHQIEGVRSVVEGRDVTFLGESPVQWQEALQDIKALPSLRKFKDKTRGDQSALLNQALHTELWLKDEQITLFGQSPEGLDKEGFVANLLDSYDNLQLVDKLRVGALASEHWPTMVDAVLGQSGLFTELRATIKGNELTIEGEAKPEVDVVALANTLKGSMPDVVSAKVMVTEAVAKPATAEGDTPSKPQKTIEVAKSSTEVPDSQALNPRKKASVKPLTAEEVALRKQCQGQLNTLLQENPIRFQRMRAELDTSSLETLDGVVTVLKRCGDADILVEGHTDSRGDKTLNRNLSDGRAKAVRKYLIEGGIGAERLEAQGYGSQHPIADNKTSAGRAKNRRIELVVSGAQE